MESTDKTENPLERAETYVKPAEENQKIKETETIKVEDDTDLPIEDLKLDEETKKQVDDEPDPQLIKIKTEAITEQVAQSIMKQVKEFGALIEKNKEKLHNGTENLALP